MKLDATALRYLSDDDFRVLTAVEMGMRNHELVPVALVSAISGLKHGGTAKSLKEAHKHKLVHRESKRYVGYRLTSLGYDYLALRALSKRGVLGAVGRPLGVGKEADVVLAAPSEALIDEHPEIADELCCSTVDADAPGAGCDGDDGEASSPMVAIKLHRLGRTSFRAVKAKRDYMAHRKSASWIYLSRLAAVKEYAFMCALHERDFPVPRPLGHSRHVVVMQLVDGVPLNQVAELDDAPKVANIIVDVIVRLARHGLVHCDLNEFNIMIGDDDRVTVIDFPQMVSTRHPDAEELYDRDLDGVERFFVHRFGMDPADIRCVSFEDAVADSLTAEDQRVDVILSASGFGSGDGEKATGIDLETLALPNDAPEVPAEGATESVVDGDPKEGDVEEEGEFLSADAVNVLGREKPGLDAPHSTKSVDDMKDMEKECSEGADSDGDETSSVYCASEYSVGGSRISQSKIAERVRRQRANQARRRQLNKRNLVKDSEKRKLKVEVDGTSLWG